MLVFLVGKRGEKAGSVLAIAKFPFLGDIEFPIEKKECERQKRDKNVFVSWGDKNGEKILQFCHLNTLYNFQKTRLETNRPILPILSVA